MSQIINKLKVFWNDLKAEASDIWYADRLLFILIIFGIFVVKFRDFFIDLLINSSNRLNKNSHREDRGLDSEEKQLNDQANDLVKKALSEEQKNSTISEDWYKKS